MKEAAVLSVLTIFLFTAVSCRTAVQPPDHGTSDKYSYTKPLKPSHYSQTEIEAQVKSYYSYWADKYLKQSDTITSWYYVLGDVTGETPASWNDTKAKATSEGHGYGMIITALMNSHNEFDGLYSMFRAFPSTGNKDLMSWIIPENEDTDLRSDSASDGDIDIAYALLLADRRWGSEGTVNYKAEAVSMINAIMRSEISHTTWRVLLGDWDDDEYSTRSSDWIPDHFRAFREASKDPRWDKVIDTLYRTGRDIYNNYSSSTGLVSDFVVKDPPRPAPAYFLESSRDGDYYYNACRVPLRIACDYVLYGDRFSEKAKPALIPVENWIIKASSGDPGNIKAGYTLKGTPLSGYSDGCFTAPFIAGATADPEYQNFLDAGWEIIRNLRSNYFSDTITLLTMMLISGIWQAP